MQTPTTRLQDSVVVNVGHEDDVTTPIDGHVSGYVQRQAMFAAVDRLGLVQQTGSRSDYRLIDYVVDHQHTDAMKCIRSVAVTNDKLIGDRK
jgi:hypothetical protein